MSKVTVEVAITKTYVIEGLQRNEVYDLINNEHTQYLYLEDIKSGNYENSLIEPLDKLNEIRIVSTMEEE